MVHIHECEVFAEFSPAHPARKARGRAGMLSTKKEINTMDNKTIPTLVLPGEEDAQAEAAQAAAAAQAAPAAQTAEDVQEPWRPRTIR